MATNVYQLPEQAVEALFEHILPGRHDRDHLAGELNLTKNSGGQRHVTWTEQRAAPVADDVTRRLASSDALDPAARHSLQLAANALRSGRTRANQRPPGTGAPGV